MKVTGDVIKGKWALNRIEIPIVIHEEAEKEFISEEVDRGVDNVKHYRVLGIKVKNDRGELVDYSKKNMKKEKVQVYNIPYGVRRKDGNIEAIDVVENATSDLTGFLSMVNGEHPPIGETVRVGDLDGHVDHIVEALVGEVNNYVANSSVERGDLSEDIEFRLLSNALYSSRVKLEVVDLNGLAEE